MAAKIRIVQPVQTVERQVQGESTASAQQEAVPADGILVAEFRTDGKDVVGLTGG